MDIQYLLIKRPYSFTSPFKGAGFVALIYAVDENVTNEEQEALSEQIVASGCRYAVCAGRHCESWHDSMDTAAIKHTGGEAADENLVMTTWHDHELLGEVISFLLSNTSFDGFAADRIVVLLVGDDESLLSNIRCEITKQLGPR